MENVYTYRLIGIKADGSDDVQDITASCEIEAEIIIESFHDGEYYLLSEGDDQLDYLHESWQDNCTAAELAASF